MFIFLASNGVYYSGAPTLRLLGVREALERLGVARGLDIVMYLLLIEEESK